MDIDLLSKMVKELILDKDRVVLPGLGSFVAEIVPSTFSDKGYTINPPYRKLYFRAKPDDEDDVSAFYAATNRLDEEVARRIMSDFLSELKKILQEKKLIVFPGLGRLRATKENHLFFIADEDLDIYPEGFGLGPVSLKTHNETPEQLSAAVVGLKSYLADKTDLEPEPVPESKPVAVPEEPEPVPESKPVAVPEEPEAVPEVEPVTVPEPTAGTKSPARIMRNVILVTLAVFLLVLAAYAVAGRVFPEFMDRFLYTPEELEIVKSLEND